MNEAARLCFLHAKHLSFNASLLMNAVTIIRLVTCSLCFSLVMTGAEAAEPSFLVKSWRTVDGLPQNTVRAIAQTPEGYLWLGTRGGLARFDGVRFLHYGLAEGLKGASVDALVEDGQGGLWIGTGGGGLSRLRQGVITTLTTADGLAHNEVTALARDGADGLWIGTRAGLQHWGPTGFTQVGENAGVRGPVLGLALSPQEGLWFSVSEMGLFNYRDGQCKFVGEEFQARSLFPSSFLVDRSGALWLGMGNHVVMRRQGGIWTEFNKEHGVPFSFIYCMAEGPEGEIWAGSHEGGLHLFQGDQFHVVPGTDASIRSINVCSDGCVWVGTQGAGLSRLTKARVSSYLVGDEIRRGQVNALVEEPVGHFWVNTWGGGVFHGPLDHLETIKGWADLKTPPFMRAGLRMSDGTVFISGNQRLLTKPPGKGSFQAAVIDCDPYALCEGPDGLLWMGTRQGELKRLIHGKVEPVDHGNFPAGILGMSRGPGKSIWLATRGAGLFQWEAGQTKQWTTKEGLPTDFLLALHEDRDGVLWIGTSGGGLAWMEQGRLHSVNSRQGLGDDVITQVLDDEAEHLWLGSHHGILRVAKRELRQVVTGTIGTVHPQVLDESDGMVTAECTGGFSPAGHRSLAGMLYFSTVRGVVAVDPNQIRPANPPPQVLIEEVKIDGKPINNFASTLSLPPGTRELEIRYTAFNYSKPAQIQFRHRLVGLDQDWLNVERERSVRYTQLPPGDYTFEVTAANLDGRFHEPVTQAAFAVQPYLWQTMGFRIITGMVLVASGGGLMRWRNRKRRLLELGELERLRRETTERQRADEKFRLAVESSPNGIVLVNAEGRIVLVNAHTEKLFGYRREELIGQAVDTLIPERYHGTHLGHRAGFIACPQARAMGAGRDLFAQRKDGSEFPVEIGLSPIKTEEGMLVLTAIADITARKQSEHELALQRSELTHLSRVSVLGKLAGTIAHELNQPLAAMLSNSQVGHRMIEAGLLDVTEMAEILEDIASDAKRAGSIIHGMRAMFKKETPQDPEPVDLNEAVTQVLSLLHSEIIACKARVELQAAKALPAVMAGRVELQQVLINLIMNGLDATKANAPGTARVDLITELRQGHVIVSVHDNGPGIASEMQARLFESFVTTKPSGLGLGLAISDGIVKQFGGTLHGENHPEGGAVFRMELPAMMS